MPSRAPGSSSAQLAYEVMIGTVLADLGFADPRACRPWARFWLADPDDPAQSGPAARDLAAHLIEAEIPLSAIAQAHARLLALETRQIAAGGAEAGAVAQWMEASHARLVLLLAAVEGHRVAAAATPSAAAPGGADQAVAALSEAAELLARSVGRLRAGAAPSLDRQKIA
jgi:hypothetical protein